MKFVNTYLAFPGNTREAMTFYAKNLGAELEMMPMPDKPELLMHSSLNRNGVSLLMAADGLGMSGAKLVAGNNFSICINCESLEEIERFFADFSEGATVHMPLQDMFWGARYGDLVDKFGIRWLFNCELPKK